MTEQHPFDTATTLAPLSEGLFQGHTSPAYGNIAGPFGGVTAANMMQAVLQDSRAQGDPISITVNFCAAVADGEFEIVAEPKRSGKYLQHWSVELTQGPKTCTTATVICAKRTADFSHQPANPPDAALYEECEPMTNQGRLNWLNRYDFRFSEGAPDFTGPLDPALRSARSVQYVSDNPPRPLDYLSLTAISDGFLLRMFNIRPKFVPMGTVSLTTHFIGSAADMAEHGDRPLLGMADATRFHGNFHDQHMQLWSASGKLLAMGTQIVWFKE